MPKLTGVFSHFQDIEKIPIADISRWLKSRGEIHSLEDSIGNRILYPQIVPVSDLELDVDFAILKEASIRQPNFFYNKQKKEIVIPQEFLIRFPPLNKLVLSIIESLTLEGVTKIYISNPKQELIGSVLTLKESEFFIGGKPVKANSGSITVLPIKEKKLTIQIGKDKKAVSLPIFGGILGIVLDLRGQG